VATASSRQEHETVATKGHPVAFVASVATEMIDAGLRKAPAG